MSPEATRMQLCWGEAGMNHPLQVMLRVILTMLHILSPPPVSITNTPVQSQFSHNTGATSGATNERAPATSKTVVEGTWPPRTQKIRDGEGAKELRGSARSENGGAVGTRLDAAGGVRAESLGEVCCCCCELPPTVEGAAAGRKL
jgi:hypothetical protein